MDSTNMEEGAITRLKLEGTETLHQLWSTPLLMAKPFDDAFIAQLKEDVKYFLKDKNDVGNLNQTDIWQLPDLPDTMIKVKEKTLELAEKHSALRVKCPFLRLQQARDILG